MRANACLLGEPCHGHVTGRVKRDATLPGRYRRTPFSARGSSCGTASGGGDSDRGGDAFRRFSARPDGEGHADPTIRYFGGGRRAARSVCSHHLGTTRSRPGSRPGFYQRRPAERHHHRHRTSGAGLGTAFQVTGTGFSTSIDGNTVTVNGRAASVSAATAESLTVALPASATSGPVVLTNAGGARRAMWGSSGCRSQTRP